VISAAANLDQTLGRERGERKDVEL
jgi:hypothetical protein